MKLTFISLLLISISSCQPIIESNKKVKHVIKFDTANSEIDFRK